MAGTLENNGTVFSLKGKIYVIPQVDETLTKAGYSADAKVTGEELDKRVRYTDIVDSLTSFDADKPASANAVRQVNDKIDQINTSQAATVGYDNSISGLGATNMQNAIDEVAQEIQNTNNSLSGIEDAMDDMMPKTGGMFEGALHFRSANNGYATVHKNNSDTTDYGTKYVDRTKNNDDAYLTLRALTNELSFTGTDGETHDIFHEGKKPFGNYTGNGSASSRMIETKGIGRLAIVYNSSCFSFVTPQGALSVKLSDGTFKWIESTKAYFLNGTLGLATTNEVFNSKDVEYYYQVI